ncbi:hypothetical protein AK830_g7706 [Neonectria ditissima]|uniref:Uncharacterized protein n=1 Tax=Neonectria ditissima TaxID=78410 RepID=A0A0N8H6G0_9HYPO|nr:hypothetical protein AK830_g7706 [Neonectria ditissima]
MSTTMSTTMYSDYDNNTSLPGQTKSRHTAGELSSFAHFSTDAVVPLKDLTHWPRVIDCPACLSPSITRVQLKVVPGTHRYPQLITDFSSHDPFAFAAMSSPQSNSPDSTDYRPVRIRSISTTSTWSQLGPMYKLPCLADLERFDGSSSVTRWLQRLDWSFEALNGSGPSPATKLKAINMLLEGDAAVAIDSSQRVRAVADKLETNEEAITEGDVMEVTSALRRMFPNEVTGSPSPRSVPLRQGEWETLSEYFGRVKEALWQAGGRDTPLEGEAELTAFERFHRSRFVWIFVQGLWAENVRAEVEQRVSLAMGLQEARDWAQWCEHLLKCRYRIAALTRTQT